MAQMQGGDDDASGEQPGRGIVLKRKKRDDSSPTKAGDALAIADMVQKLCQVPGLPIESTCLVLAAVASLVHLGPYMPAASRHNSCQRCCYKHDFQDCKTPGKRHLTCSYSWPAAAKWSCVSKHPRNAGEVV